MLKARVSPETGPRGDTLTFLFETSHSRQDMHILVMWASWDSLGWLREYNQQELGSFSSLSFCFMVMQDVVGIFQWPIGPPVPSLLSSKSFHRYIHRCENHSNNYVSACSKFVYHNVQTPEIN